MSDRKFAPWVEPLAQRLTQSREDLKQVVRDVPDAAWGKPSSYSGWTYKDHLSHLPESHRAVQTVLNAIVAGESPDFSRFLKIDTINEDNRQRHLATPVDELVASFQRESEETESILANLTAEQADTKLGPMTLGQAFQGFSMHDASHIEEIKKALS